MEAEITKLMLRSSLPVPCVQELAKETLTTVPLRYVRPDQDPPFVFNATSSTQIPIIDVHKLLFSEDFGGSELDKLHHACKDWGFFQIITNGIYRSIEHRVTVNSVKERLSVATFCGPRLDGDMGPSPSLLASSERVALFKRIGVMDYYKGFFSREIIGKSYLDTMRIQTEVIEKDA